MSGQKIGMRAIGVGILIASCVLYVKRRWYARVTAAGAHPRMACVARAPRRIGPSDSPLRDALERQEAQPEVAAVMALIEGGALAADPEWNVYEVAPADRNAG